MIADQTMSLRQLQGWKPKASDGSCHPSFLGETIGFAVQRLLDAEAGEVTGAAPGEHITDRLTQGNRDRDWKAWSSTVEFQIPKLERGLSFPAFLEPRRPAEKALKTVIQEAASKAARPAQWPRQHHGHEGHQPQPVVPPPH